MRLAVLAFFDDRAARGGSALPPAYINRKRTLDIFPISEYNDIRTRIPTTGRPPKRRPEQTIPRKRPGSRGIFFTLSGT